MRRDVDRGVSAVQVFRGRWPSMVAKVLIFIKLNKSCDGPTALCDWSRFPQVVFGGELQEKGCHFELKVNNAEDLNRCSHAGYTGVA